MSASQNYLPTERHAVLPRRREDALRGAHAKHRYHPRQLVLDEIVAGFVWIHLDLPANVSRLEIESFARRLVCRIRANAPKIEIEKDIMALQFQQLFRPIDMSAIRRLAERAILVVRQAEI